MKDIRLVVIDMQNDFCDPNGSLFIQGADKDTLKVASFIRKNVNKITGIHATLDSHSVVDIAHTIWWIDKNGNHPNPFTIISVDDVKSGVWRSFCPDFQKISLNYVEELNRRGRYVLCIWPPHCLISSWGHNTHPELFKAYMEWENKFKKVDYRTKGSNPFTEHYSALEAEVPDSNDPATMLDTSSGSLIDIASSADEVYFVGEALSHCCACTIRSLVNNFGDDNIKKTHLLLDCMSNVTGFEKLGNDFVDEMRNRGMNIIDNSSN